MNERSCRRAGSMDDDASLWSYRSSGSFLSGGALLSAGCLLSAMSYRTIRGVFAARCPGA